MDVTLITTHRCNLACEYCYAGEHHRNEMDDETMEKALDLLYADGADTAQLSFFGGEPFLAFERIAKAIDGARERADFLGRTLTLQCTTNGTLLSKKQLDLIIHSGMQVTVSLDGIQEAHDLTRRKSGGGSSFDAVYAGLRLLLDSGLSPSVLMVITPETAPFLFRSTRWLWEEGVEDLRLNLSLRANWNKEARDTLKRELVAVGRELLFRRLRGEKVAIDAIDEALQKGACGGERGKKTLQVVVGTSGNLYPCAPMVGEDRDSGPEARLRLGHISDSPEQIVSRVRGDGAGCGDGEACTCASYIETGDRGQAGPNGLWFHRVSVEVSRAVQAGLASARSQEPPAKDRRKLLQGILMGAAGLAVAGGLVAVLLPKEAPEARLRTAGAMARPDTTPTSAPVNEEPPVTETQSEPLPPRIPAGKMMSPRVEPEAPIVKTPSVKTRGKMVRPKDHK